jgi:site-specific recombinase XerD
MKMKLNSSLFFSLTYEFLHVYLPIQAGCSRWTTKSYRDALRQFHNYVTDGLGKSISDFEFTECSRDCVYGFLEWLKKNGNKRSTSNQRLAALKSYLRFAADKDASLLQVMLAIKNIRPMRVVKTCGEVLSEETLSVLFTQPGNTRKGMRDLAILVLLYDSAMRISELLNLKVTDLQLERNPPFLRVLGKGSKERIVAISEKTVPHLKLYLKTFLPIGTDIPWLFYTCIKASIGPMSDSNVERIITKYSNSARCTCSEIPARVHSHMFRNPNFE